MRVVYFGSGAFGLPTLGRLFERHEVAAVITQPDRPSGRGGRPTPTPVAEQVARAHPQVELLKPERIRETAVVQRVRSIPADAWVVIAYGQKLPSALLEGRFAINLHASLLPRWRGAAPINAAILAGDTVTGNSVITLADRMDAGLILGQTERAIEPTRTAGELHDLLAADGPDLVERVLSQHAGGTLAPRTQDESLVTIAGKLSREDDSFDAQQPADFLRRQIHALTPWPGVTVVFDPESPGAIFGKIGRAATGEPVGEGGHEPGRLINADAGEVACGHGSTLRVLEFQPRGKRMMSWAEFRRGAGRALRAGVRVASPREFGS